MVWIVWLSGSVSWQVVRQCATVQAAVCGSAHGSVHAVCRIVCGSALGSVWQSALSSSAAVCGIVRQCAAV
jgi:hypothetical protein